MEINKVKRIYYLSAAQVVLQIIFLIWGFHFKSDSSEVSSTILGMVSKVQSTNDIQNFVWLFTHNLTIMFVVFWVSYFSFGIIGTLWTINNAFMIGALAKVYLIFVDDAWLALLFMSLEFIAATLVMVSSTSFRIEKSKLKKAFKYSLSGFDENYISRKKKLERNILYVFGMVAVILFVAAILETIVLSTI